VAVHNSLTAVFIPTRETIDTEVVDLITIQERKILTFVQFLDTAALVRIGSFR
jgi:hypothetical protein